ncbi:MAG TPA: secretin N-terminal domain-containing protein [Vicinamibacterales bacterium]|nr:secretin N-terminal domain-containing protein [Vicinamibacterales bacterium]
MSSSRIAEVAVVVLLAAVGAGCATSAALRAGRRAEDVQDYDRAVADYTAVVRKHPDNVEARSALGRARLRAAQDHAFRGRRFVAADRFEEALVEYQLASELNPGDGQVDAALQDVRQRLRTKLRVERGGRTELQDLIDRSRQVPTPGLDLRENPRLPTSLVFSNASSRMVFTALARFGNVNLVFDPAFRDQPISIDLRNTTLEDALKSLTASTGTFYHVTAPRTITIAPDTAAKRREYEESVVQTFYLSNADIKEVIDLLRVVMDIRQVSAITATNAISIKDTPERVAGAARLIEAIDKARPEVVIDVELLEVDRSKLQEYGLQAASPGSDGISGSADANRTGLTLQGLRNLTQADILVAGLPSLYYKLLKNDTDTRTLANPQLRTAEGITATARFGDQVPLPVTTFAPIATGGINQQPITSYVYQNVGVNIDITPRTHHNNDVTLAVKVVLSSISGTGFGGLPTLGNREISTTIRLKDGETNMLAGLIRDDERTVLSGIPGLSDLPVIGHLFASNHKERQQTDIILTLTPHIVRVLDLKAADLRPFLVGHDTGAAIAELPSGSGTPRDTQEPPGAALEGTTPSVTSAPEAPKFPQPLEGALPGVKLPAPKKPGGGGV